MENLCFCWLWPLDIGLALISVAIGSQNREGNAKGLFCMCSRRSWLLPALVIASQFV